MQVFPLNTLPRRAKSRFDEQILWPWNTYRAARRAYKQAREREGHVSKTILFYPEKPKTFHTLYKICAHLGWKITTNPKEHFDTAIFFEDTTVRKIPQKLIAVSQHQPVVNLHSTDISKRHIDEVFGEVFGYAMSVDPETYKGTCVRKSDTNAVHDGAIITCPTKREEGYVYQKLIDTTQQDGRAMDLRLNIWNGNVPIVIKRYKSKDDLFDITVDAEFTEPYEVLSEHELELIARFSKKLGIDYGEFDALRDNSDGRLYIVDVNNTPAGPIGPFYAKPEDMDRWYTEVSKETEKAFLLTSQSE